MRDMVARRLLAAMNATNTKWLNQSGDFESLDASRPSYVGIAGSNYSGGVISGTPTTQFGALYITTATAQGLRPGRKYLFTALVMADSPVTAAMNCYQFAGATNNGNTKATDLSIGTTWTRISQTITLRSDTDKVQQGLLNVSPSVAPFVKLYMKQYMVIDISDNALSASDVDKYGGYWTGYPTISTSSVATKWTGKNVLCIGDSLTAANQWQAAVISAHGCTITNHALGGIGIVDPINGVTNSNGTIAALTQAQVADKDLIIVFLGMNERSTGYGANGDLYPTQSTLWGKLQYTTNAIYNFLVNSGNQKCKILFVTPHCAGKYASLEVDGYGENPAGSGRTLETMANQIKMFAGMNNCQCVDLWHDSGIGRYTWSVYAANATQTAAPPSVDQLHLNALGYTRIGDVIAAKMNMI